MMGWISVLAAMAAFQAPDAAPAARPATPLAAAEADWAKRPTEGGSGALLSGPRHRGEGRRRRHPGLQCRQGRGPERLRRLQ